MGAGFFLGRKKSEVLSYVSLISLGLTNYFPRNFSILNATGEKWIYPKRIAFMFQKLEQCKSFSQVPLSLSVSFSLLLFLQIYIYTNYIYIIFLYTSLPMERRQKPDRVGKSHWQLAELLAGYFNCVKVNRNKAYSLYNFGIEKAKSVQVFLVRPVFFCFGL